nr:hypothetical protein [Tanacetum cinerariifolium]
MGFKAVIVINDKQKNYGRVGGYFGGVVMRGGLVLVVADGVEVAGVEADGVEDRIAAGVNDNDVVRFWWLRSPDIKQLSKASVGRPMTQLLNLSNSLLGIANQGVRAIKCRKGELGATYVEAVGNMDSSIGKMCLGQDIIEIFSDRNEGSGDWDSPKYKDTARSGGKKEPKALVFHKMYTEEVSDRYIAQYFMNGLYAPDGEINLEKNDNLISNNYAVKLCLEYEVRKGKKLVKKELMVSLRGEIYFVQFIINPEEDEFEPGLIFRSDEEGNPNLDDLEMLLDFDFDEIPQIETNLPPMEDEKWALAHSIGMRYEMLEEVSSVIETLAYNDKYRKLLDEIWADKVRLDGKIKAKEERAIVKVKGQMIKEKKDPGAFIFPIRLAGLINENALADTRFDINTMPYRIYEQLGRDDIMKEDRNITMINYTEAEVTGRLVNVLCQVGLTTMSAKFLIIEIPIDRDAPIVDSLIQLEATLTFTTEY